MQRLQPITTQPPATRPPTTADRLQTARQRVRLALQFADGGELTIETLDIISRALVAATSELERVAIELDTRRERMVS
jgi:hypothetical protein